MEDKIWYVFKHKEIKNWNDCPLNQASTTPYCKLLRDGERYLRECYEEGRPSHCPLMKTGIASKLDAIQ